MKPWVYLYRAAIVCALIAVVQLAFDNEGFAGVWLFLAFMAIREGWKEENCEN